MDFRDVKHTHHPLRATVAITRSLFQAALHEFEEKPASAPRMVEPPTELLEVDDTPTPDASAPAEQS